MTNPFRRRVAASLRSRWRSLGPSWAPTERAEVTGESDVRGASRGWGRDVRKAERSKRRDLAGVCEPAGVRARIVPRREGRERPGQQNRVEGRGAGRWKREGRNEAQSSTGSADEGYSKVQKPSANWSWVEASVWTERMVSALDNGVKGGRWYSLIDKVCAPKRCGRPGRKSRPTRARRAWTGKASNGSRRGRKST